MLSKRLWLIPLLTVAAAAHAADPTPTADSGEKERQKDIADAEKEAKSMPSLGKVSVSDVVSLRMVKGLLTIESPRASTDGVVSFVLKEQPGFGTLNIMHRAGDNGRAFAGFSYVYRDFSKPGSEIQTSVYYPNVQVDRDVESPTQVLSIQLLQNPSEDPATLIHLYVKGSDQQAGTPLVDLNLTAPSLAALRRRYPREVAAYLMPIFHDLRADDLLSVDKHAAWQIFAANYVAPPELAGQVKALVAKLDADAPAERTAATRQLQSLGQGAAIVAMMLDRAQFSPEQNAGLDAFLEAYAPLSPEQVQRLGRDADFLLDCFTSDDVQLRKAAVPRLDEVLGHPSGLDPNAADAVRFDAAAKVRAVLPSPATQQVKTEE